MRLSPEPCGEGERAAPPRLALHTDLAAHQADQPRGDGQAQAGAAVPSRGGAVHLFEGPEDPVQIVGRDADTGVGHHEAENGLPLGAGSLATSTRTTTSPCSVNLMALLTRLSTTCLSRTASPTNASGTSGCTW